ncbi:MAG: hypothetical protein IJ209_02175 [Bacteroidaceae bacterium]|nr:hypothetical protein [Bacteroidaceae bacterium]
MDYKYIEQLIDHYFEGETTLEEEHILREFFAQGEVPEHLRQWQQFFRSEAELSGAHLDERFDRRIMELVGETHVTARRITLARRLRPLFKAAAFVAFAIVIGTALEHATSLSTPAEPQGEAVVQDEFDPGEATPLDIRSAEVVEMPDSTKANVH